MRATQAAHEVRIVGGQWKRTKLAVLEREGLRPTPDRVRETLYNWLGQDLAGWRVLDAFAGSGALGFEAASRGAASVVCVEQDKALVDALRAARTRLQATMIAVEFSDALAWMSGRARIAPSGFELVLLDPPFGARLHARAIAAAQPLLAPGGFLYVEAGEVLTAPAGLIDFRHLRAGHVHAHLWHRPDDDRHHARQGDDPAATLPAASRGDVDDDRED